MSSVSMELPKNGETGTKNKLRYELLPPDGGWGYVITLAVALTVSTTAQPMCAFGLVYGGFLRSIGDETTGTTLANGIFNTVFSITGLLSNHLLQKYSCRVVGFMGAALFSIGAASTVFVTNLWQIIVSFGFIQGLGFGLLLPSVYSALNLYFDKRINLMMGLSQAFMILVSICAPSLAKLSMDMYGFRATVALLAALSLNTFPAILSLQPVKRHMIKKPILENKLLNSETNPKEKSVSLCEEVLRHQIQPLLEKDIDDVEKNRIQKYLKSESRSSIGSFGEGYLSISTVNHVPNFTIEEKTTSNKSSMDLSLFKELRFMNISIGMSLSFCSDIAFISVFPMILSGMGFTTSQTATTMSVFFISDFISRLALSALSAAFQIRNRYVFLGGTAFSALFRCGYVISSNYYWTLGISAILGFLRCLIQTPLPLVITDEYPENFASAFSLFMVVSGVVNLIFAFLMSFVKSYTGSNEMVIHLLTLAFIICTVTWLAELTFKKKPKENNMTD